MLVPEHGPAREQRIAVLAVARVGVGAVHRLVALGGQVLGLGYGGPAVEVMLLLAVEAAHFLQADDIGIELFHRQPQVVDLQPPRRPQSLHPLVDVVGGHAQDVGGFGALERECRGHGVIIRGNNKIASALEGEVQQSAASRQPIQAYAVCSRGFKATACGAGTCRPKTRSVLCHTPGA